MRSTTFTMSGPDGVSVFVYRWLPEKPATAVVQISHGMQEHAGRYAPLAERLTAAGYAVFANDQLGHGRTALGGDKQGQLGVGGWDAAVRIVKQLTDHINAETPGLPVFLLGHSWGSFLAQNYIGRWGSGLAGVLLSGTHGEDPLVGIGIIIASLDRALRGRTAPGGLLEKLSVGGLNKTFEPARTPFDWISRDPTTVDKYAADPYCGKPFPNGFFQELTRLLAGTWRKEKELQIPKDLPVLLFSGTRDPVSKFGATVKALSARYSALGIRDITLKLYEGARHETLNETNRDEVVTDIIAWLDAHRGHQEKSLP
jgi:alpha-beta hydrolase superfamily lysophospholipase